MVTELTTPEQLERHFRSTARITYRTSHRRPVAALIEVKTRRGIDFILPKHLTNLRQHIRLLRGVQVGDTTVALIELVVPRDSTTGYKTLRDEVELLLKGKVGEHAGDGLQLITRCGHAGRRVLDVGYQRVVTPRSVRELHREEVRRHTVGTRPLLLLEELTVITIIVTRGLLLGIRTSQVHLELRGLRNLEVQVRTHVQTVVGITAGVTLMVIPYLCHITLVLEVEGHEILHKLRTPAYIKVRVIRESRPFKHLVLPVHVRIALRLAVFAQVRTVGSIVRRHRVVLMAEVVDERLRTVVGPRSVTPDADLVLNRLVAHHIAVVAVVLPRQLRHGLQGSVEANVDPGLAFHATLGGNQDNTVSTLHAIHRRGRGVLQHRDRSHRCHVHRLDLTLHAVHQYQRLGVRVPGSRAADIDARILFTRLTGRGDGGNTGHVTRQRSTHAADTRRPFQHFTRGLGNGTHHRRLLLLAETDHDHFRKLGVVAQRHVQRAPLADLQLFGVHSHIRDHDGRRL